MDVIFDTVAIGSDHAGYDLKQQLIDYVQVELNLNVVNVGSDDDQPSSYPLYAHKVAHYLQNHPRAMGCLICGTGIGMSITVNRYDHIRAALCNDSVSTVAIARAHNDANILCLGGRLSDINFAQAALKIFLTTQFEGGRHQDRINLINDKI